MRTKTRADRRPSESRARGRGERLLRSLAACLLILTACLLRSTPSWAAADPARFVAYEGRTLARISVVGNRTTRLHVVTRELALREGTPFHLDLLQADLQRLENLGIFSSVGAAPRDSAQGLELLIEVRESPAVIPAPAVSYTEQNGWAAGVALAALNLGGRNIRLSGVALLGGSNSCVVNVVEPWIAGNHLSIDLSAGWLGRTDVLNEFEERSRELTPWVGTWIGRNWRAGLGFSYLEMRSDVAGKTLSPGNRDRLYRLGGFLGLDSRNSWRDATAGWEGKIAWWRTGGPLGGAGDSLGTSLDLRRYVPLGGGQALVVAGLLETQSGRLGVDVPLYLQYFLGGANSVRGYSLEEARQDGGKNELIGTLEYHLPLVSLREVRVLRWPFSVGVQLALFSDQGIAWSAPSEFALDRAKAGAGVGLRLLVPGLDMLRLDLALNRRGGVQLHFSGGVKMNVQRSRLR